MKKILFLIFVSSSLFALRPVVGFGYGVLQTKAEINNAQYRSSKIRDLHFKGGVEFENSRFLLTLDNPSMNDKEKLKITTLSAHALDSTSKYIKGFFGVGYSVFDYSHSTASINEKKNAYGLEIGILLLEEGKVYENMEMEFGYRYFITKGISNKSGFELKNFTNYYIGFNYLF